MYIVKLYIYTFFILLRAFGAKYINFGGNKNQ